MILHRFSQAIKKQDWFTVLLEILIVVVGIFLGLQVDDWNEARKYRLEEAAYLEKIEDDLARMREDLIGKNEGFERRITAMISALRALESCDTSETAVANVKYALESYQAAPPIDYLGATYNEMVASGALARLANQALKSKIAQAFSALESINSAMRNFRISVPVVDEIVWKEVSYSFNTETRRQIADVSITKVCDKQQFRNAVVEMIDIQNDGQTAIRRALESVDELLKLLQQTRL